MPLIDTHVHLVDPLLPGSKPLPEFFQQGPQAIVKAVMEAYRPGHTLLAMGSLSCSVEDPLGIKTSRIVAQQLAQHDLKVGLIGIIDPRFGGNAGHLERIEQLAAQKAVVAFKGYLGYLHFEPTHVKYEAYLKIAEKHNIPVIFHTGDTYSTKALLKYAHPLMIDELAVKYPTVQFVMAHMGNPWLTDAAAVMFKNANVWADLSAIVSTEQPQDSYRIMEHVKALKMAGTRLDEAIAYTEASDRLLFGTDWPLVNPTNYEQWLGEVMHSMQPDFDKNAERLFNLASLEINKPSASYKGTERREVQRTAWPTRAPGV